MKEGERVSGLRGRVVEKVERQDKKGQEHGGRAERQEGDERIVAIRLEEREGGVRKDWKVRCTVVVTEGKIGKGKDIGD